MTIWRIYCNACQTEFYLDKKEQAKIEKEKEELERTIEEAKNRLVGQVLAPRR